MPAHKRWMHFILECQETGSLSGWIWEFSCSVHCSSWELWWEAGAGTDLLRIWLALPRDSKMPKPNNFCSQCKSWCFVYGIFLKKVYHFETPIRNAFDCCKIPFLLNSILWNNFSFYLCSLLNWKPSAIHQGRKSFLCPVTFPFLTFNPFSYQEARRVYGAN